MPMVPEKYGHFQAKLMFANGTRPPATSPIRVSHVATIGSVNR